MTRFQKLAVSTTATTFALVAAGGLVRATGSGDSCPTWPGCYPHRFFPVMNAHALIEWSHRTLVIVVTVLIAALAVQALRRHRNSRTIWMPAVAAGFVVIAQAAIGALRIVNPQARAFIVTAHLATAMLLIATLLATTIAAFMEARPTERTAATADLSHLAAVAAAAVALLVLVGAYVRGIGAGLAFGDWPLMGGRLLPDAGHVQTPQFVHRLLALVVGLLVGAVAWRALRRDRSQEPVVRRLAFTAAALFVAQILAGAANVWSKLASAAVVAHVLLAALTWGATFSLALITRRLAKAAAAGSQTLEDTTGKAPAAGIAHAKAVLNAYFRLTKPRIIVLLLITTVPSMVVADRGWPGWMLVGATLLGGTLAAGGANAINCYIDRDIDARMGRTVTRPIPAGVLTPGHALEFGIGLGLVAFGYLWWAVNLLSAALAIAALLFYVFVYTIGLKRSTPQNIVIGGAAGAVPVLVGWSAVTGTLTWAPVVMFAIIFFWTPPHFWALSLRFAKDYERAGVPMMPVVAGFSSTRKQILVYSFVLVAVTLAMAPVGRLGLLYLAAAGGLGAWFIAKAALLWRRGTEKAAMSLFKFSINYLALLFAAMALGAVVHV